MSKAILFASLFLYCCYANTCSERATEGISVMSPTNLRCEYQVNPLGIDALPPRLSWTLAAGEPPARALSQTAYQVLAASDPAALASGQGDLWDSGKVISSNQINMPYEGAALHSGQRVWWKVRVWDNQNALSQYSEAAWWEMGLLERGDWQGKWIRQAPSANAATTDPFAEDPAPLFRHEFSVAKPVRLARAYVSGLGYYELRLNGRRVGDHELDPGWTSYAKRVFYATYDVTSLLEPGANALGCLVGNGWYNPLPLRMWNRINLCEALCTGAPRMILQLHIEYEDGSVQEVVSDESWKTAASPVRRNNVYLGEVYDARCEQPGWDRPGFDDSTWTCAAAASAELETLEAQSIPPIRVIDRMPPRHMARVVPEAAPRVEGEAPADAAAPEAVFLYDLGENIAGRVRIHCNGPAGARVQLRYGELLYPDGTLNPMTSVCGQIKGSPVPEGSSAPSTAWQCDTLILKGNGTDIFAPRFAFHGFRYVEVRETGPDASTRAEPGSHPRYVQALEGERLHTDVLSAGVFEASNELLNRIQEISVRALRGNMHSVQSDCPHREKFGYGGDLVADSGMGLYNFDMAAFYGKIVQDFGDAARPNGGFTETAPFVGIDDAGLGEGAGPVGWGTAHPLLLWQLYQHYGEERLLRAQYPAARKWMALLQDKAEDFILINGLGDHESLAPKDIALSGTAFFYHNAWLMARLAQVLDYDQDTAIYQELARKIRGAFNARFLNRETGQYGAGTQADQAFALHLGLVPENMQEKALHFLVHDIQDKHNGHLSTGIFGTKYLLAALAEYGAADAAYQIVNRRDFPGWGYMIENGATTLWEHWAFSDNTYSHNHPMFGSVSEWFFQALAGIRPDEAACGFDHVVIKPHVVDGLQWVRARHDSIRGRILSAWRLEDNQLHLEVEIPPNSEATVYVPVREGGVVLKGGLPAEKATGITPLDTEPGYAPYHVLSGRYAFTTPWTR